MEYTLAKVVVLLTGRIASGKTTLSDELVKRFGFRSFKTKDWINRLSENVEQGRLALQSYGELLDRRTKGAWVCGELIKDLNGLGDYDGLVVVDAVRVVEQIDAIRNAFGPRVIHIHLSAPEKVLEKRFKQRRGKGGFKEAGSYEEVRNNKTEADVEKLTSIADVVIDTSRCTKDDVVIRAASHLGLYDREYRSLVDVLVGGQYGSEGKGNIASYLAREYDMLIRVGGPNAGHKVYEEPAPYTFHQLPSGTRSSEAQIVIGPGALINIGMLLKEIADCQVDADRLSIDPQAMIIEERDKRNERPLIEGIASTGQGVGYATARRIIGRGIPNGKNKVRLAKDVHDLRPFVRETHELLERAFSSGKKIFLEGTQGTGLSLFHGYYPWVTSRDTTVAGCLAEAGISPRRVRKVIIVCRTYPIRVGNAPETQNTSGYMSQELAWSEISRRCGVSLTELVSKERTSTTNRERRVSEFDWQLLRKAASLNAPTDVALTFVDYLDMRNKSARRFEQLTEETIRFIEEVEHVTAAPVSLISTRFHSRNIIDRRAW
jgi:adenylosuccinate synthase